MRLSMNFYAIIMAAGSGIRMGTSIPKQFLTVNGVPILRMTMEKFIQACPDVHIITVLPEDSIAYWKEYCLQEGFHHTQILVGGGITRFHSVKNALEKLPDDAVVAVHDGVRPLVSTRLIMDMLSRMENVQALIPVVPIVDTVKVIEKDSTGLLREIEGASADRSILYGAQTPQMFHASVLKDAYNQAFDTAFTDDASVVSKKGFSLSFIEGERYNIKVTVSQDLEAVRLLSSS